MSETVKVYISGYYEYRVDNPAALADAARFTPSEIPGDELIEVPVEGSAARIGDI